MECQRPADMMPVLSSSFNDANHQFLAELLMMDESEPLFDDEPFDGAELREDHQRLNLPLTILANFAIKKTMLLCDPCHLVPL